MSDYEKQRQILIAYLRMKVDVGDWHGAADACNDLRELDACEKGRLSFQPEPYALPAQGN